MYFSLIIYSKNKDSLNNFLFFISKLKSPIKIITNSPKLKKKNFLSVLKSPHVNKDAQEQFEFRIYSKKILIWSPQFKILISIFKKAIRTSFPGIKIQINSFSDTKGNYNFLLKSLNPGKLNLNFFKNRNKNRFLVSKKISNYLNLSDCYGYSYFKKVLSTK